MSILVIQAVKNAVLTASKTDPEKLEVSSTGFGRITEAFFMEEMGKNSVIFDGSR